MAELSDAQRADLKVIFDSYDTDKNGEITRDELKKAFKRMGLPMSDLHIASILGKLDTNRNQTIDFEEFCARNEAVASQEVFKYLVDAVMHEEFVISTIRISYNDGFLTADEVCEMAKDLGYGAISKEHAEWLIRAVDRSNNGKISYEEFKALTLAL